MTENYEIDTKNKQFISHKCKILAEKLRLNLSLESDASVSDIFMNKSQKIIKADITLSRGKFIELIAGELDKIRLKSLKCIQNSKIDIQSISEILVSGGVSKTPCIEDLLKTIFSFNKITRVPENYAAIGASIYSAINQKLISDIILNEILVQDIRVLTHLEKVGRVIKKGAAIPSPVKSLRFENEEIFDVKFRIDFIQGNRSSVTNNSFILTKFIDSNLK